MSISFQGTGVIKEIVLHSHPTQLENRKLVIIISFDDHASAGQNYAFSVLWPSEIFNKFFEPELTDGNSLLISTKHFRLRSNVNVTGTIKLSSAGRGSLVLESIKKVSKKKEETQVNGKSIHKSKS